MVQAAVKRAERAVRRPTQARGDRTVGAIRAAALKLLARRDISAITVAELARRARVSVGAFYHYFPSKEALVIDLRNHLFAETSATLTEAFVEPVDSPQAFLQTVRRLLKGWIAVAARHRGLERAAIALSYERTEVAAALRAQEQVLRDLAAALLQRYAKRLRPCQPDRTAACIFITIDAVISRTMREPQLADDCDWLIDEAVRMVGHYLMADALTEDGVTTTRP